MGDGEDWGEILVSGGYGTMAGTLGSLHFAIVPSKKVHK